MAEVVDANKLENVNMVEVPFAVGLPSKKGPVVLAAVGDMVNKARQLRLGVRRIHSDRQGVNEPRDDELLPASGNHPHNGPVQTTSSRAAGPSVREGDPQAKGHQNPG